MSCCGALGIILCLFCRSGCQASVVASFLAFHPPSPFYEITYNEETKKYSIAFSTDLPDVRYENLKVTILETKTKTKVPVLCLTHPEAKYTVIYSHGNATDCGAMFVMYAMIALSLKVNVVGYDYTGYGASMKYNVRPTEKQTYKDIDCVYDWCIENKIVKDPAKEVILYGQSVGSGPSTYLASTRPVAGLVLHSPIMSGLRVVMKSRLLCCCDIFPNINRITRVKSPVFVIHGLQDREVKVEHGNRLYSAVPKEYQYDPWWVPDRGHNDVLQHNEKEFLKRLRAFRDYIDERNKGGEKAASVPVASKGGKNSYALVDAGESKMDNVIKNAV